MTSEEKVLAVTIALIREIQAEVSFGIRLKRIYNIPHTTGMEWGCTELAPFLEKLRRGQKVYPTQQLKDGIVAICQEFRFSFQDTEDILRHILMETNNVNQ